MRYGRSVNPAPIFLVVGAPAVGKSTTSRALARRFERAVHIPVDDLRDMVLAGAVLPAPDWSDALVEQVRLARQSAIAMALAYAGAGFTVVIDDFWDPPGLVEYDELAAGRSFCRVLLRPDREEALRRNYGRHGEDPVRAYLDEGIHLVYDALGGDHAAARLAQGQWLVLDTTQLDVDAAVDGILAHAGLSSMAAPG